MTIICRFSFGEGKEKTEVLALGKLFRFCTHPASKN